MRIRSVNIRFRLLFSSNLCYMPSLDLTIWQLHFVKCNSSFFAVAEICTTAHSSLLQQICIVGLGYQQPNPQAHNTNSFASQRGKGLYPLPNQLQLILIFMNSNNMAYSHQAHWSAIVGYISAYSYISVQAGQQLQLQAEYKNQLKLIRQRV